VTLCMHAPVCCCAWMPLSVDAWGVHLFAFRHARLRVPLADTVRSNLLWKATRVAAELIPVVVVPLPLRCLRRAVDKRATSG
jgi:hypothetical protein